MTCAVVLSDGEKDYYVCKYLYVCMYIILFKSSQIIP